LWPKLLQYSRKSATLHVSITEPQNEEACNITGAFFVALLWLLLFLVYNGSAYAEGVYIVCMHPSGMLVYYSK